MLRRGSRRGKRCSEQLPKAIAADAVKAPGQFLRSRLCSHLVFTPVGAAF